MYLVIGGSFQGKLQWVLTEFAVKAGEVADGGNIEWQDGCLHLSEGVRVLDNLEQLIERMQKAGLAQTEVSAAIGAALDRLPEDVTVICDEVGIGLVPVDIEGRIYRELVGRTCCELAARASRVFRVYCGIPQVLK